MGKIGFGNSSSSKTSVLKRSFIRKGESQRYFIIAPPVTIANHEFYIKSQKQSHYLSCNVDKEGWCAACMMGLTNGRLVNRILLPVARPYSYTAKDNSQKSGVEVCFLPIKSQAVQTGLLKGIDGVSDPNKANYSEWVGVEIEVSRSMDDKSPGSGDFASVIKKHGKDVLKKMQETYPHLNIPEITPNNVEKYATTILSNNDVQGYIAWMNGGGGEFAPSAPSGNPFAPSPSAPSGNPFSPAPSSQTPPQAQSQISDEDIPF